MSKFPTIHRRVRAENFFLSSFTMLDAYFKTTKDEAAAAMVDTKKGKIKNKATIGDEKKRKNAKGSQGVEKLKKVNVNGMAKLSSFFKKT